MVTIEKEFIVKNPSKSTTFSNSDTFFVMLWVVDDKDNFQNGWSLKLKKPSISRKKQTITVTIPKGGSKKITAIIEPPKTAEKNKEYEAYVKVKWQSKQGKALDNGKWDVKGGEDGKTPQLFTIGTTTTPTTPKKKWWPFGKRSEMVDLKNLRKTLVQLTGAHQRIVGGGFSLQLC